MQRISSSTCFTPLAVGASGKRATLSASRDYSLHFDESLSSVRAGVKVKPGIAVGFLRRHLNLFREKMTCLYPFQRCFIGNLGIHVDQASAFIDADQIVSCLSRRVTALFQKDLRPWDQKLLTSACVLLHEPSRSAQANLHMGNKPIGTVKKTAFCNIFVFHDSPRVTVWHVIWSCQKLTNSSKTVTAFLIIT